MSSVGFNTVSPDKELEKLREAWRSLNDLMRNINSAEQSLKKGDLKLIAVHLKVAKWNVDQVKKSMILFQVLALSGKFLWISGAGERRGEPPNMMPLCTSKSLPNYTQKMPERV